MLREKFILMIAKQSLKKGKKLSSIKNAPDVAGEKQGYKLPIDLVGLKDVEMPVKLTNKIQNSAKISLQVSLDSPLNRGVHMSRLYLLLHDNFSKKPISFSLLKKSLSQGIKSQKGASSSGHISVKSRWPVLRKALKSSLQGWREYPFYFDVLYSSKKKKFEFIVGGEILYSSTCPCSTSLSLNLIKNHFEKKLSSKQNFTQKEILKSINDTDFLVATPHAQKSSAFFKAKIKESALTSFSLIKLIDEIEAYLGTAVQTAVKREDEAEFARKNAENLMFCEDAVRRLGSLFKTKKEFSAYSLHVEHYESLHPFTVQSQITKGFEGG